jgi:hypothetical protein
MVLLLILLILADALIGVLAWVVYQRLTAHMRNDPQAAELVAKHVIAPLLTGNREQEAKEVQ